MAAATSGHQNGASNIGKGVAMVGVAGEMVVPYVVAASGQMGASVAAEALVAAAPPQVTVVAAAAAKSLVRG